MKAENAKKKLQEYEKAEKAGQYCTGLERLECNFALRDPGIIEVGSFRIL